MDMNNLIFNVLMALVVAICGVIARTLRPYLKAKKEEAMTQIRRTKWAWAADIIDAVVRAVEQTVGEEIHGADKKAVAFEYIKSMFAQSGITLTDDEISKLIEAAVQAMNAAKAGEAE